MVQRPSMSPSMVCCSNDHWNPKPRNFLTQCQYSRQLSLGGNNKQAEFRHNDRRPADPGQVLIRLSWPRTLLVRHRFRTGLHFGKRKECDVSPQSFEVRSVVEARELQAWRSGGLRVLVRALTINNNKSICVRTLGVCTVGACYPDTPNSVLLHIRICVHGFHHSGSFARARQCHHGDANFHALSAKSPLGPHCPNLIAVCSKHA